MTVTAVTALNTTWSTFKRMKKWENLKNEKKLPLALNSGPAQLHVVNPFAYWRLKPHSVVDFLVSDYCNAASPLLCVP